VSGQAGSIEISDLARHTFLLAKESMDMEYLGRSIDPRNVNYLIVDDVEIGNLTGVRDLAGAGNDLLRVNKLTKTIVKLGAEGCLMISKQRSERIPGVDQEAFGMKAINTVGCGDTFLRFFSALKAEGVPDAEALRKANAAGAFKATKAQTRGSPLKKELKSSFKERSQCSARKSSDRSIIVQGFRVPGACVVA